jgi:hypothetical protein
MSDSSACKQVYASTPSIVYDIITLILTGGLALIAQFTITPLLNGSADKDLDGCPQKEGVKEAIQDFINLSSIATFASLFMTVFIDLYSSRAFTRYGKDVPTLSSKMAALFRVATGVKCVLILTALYSVYKVYSAYPTCKKLRADSIKKDISQQVSQTLKILNQIPARTFSMLRS